MLITRAGYVLLSLSISTALSVSVTADRVHRGPRYRRRQPSCHDVDVAPLQESADVCLVRDSFDARLLSCIRLFGVVFGTRAL